MISCSNKKNSECCTFIQCEVMLQDKTTILFKLKSIEGIIADKDPFFPLYKNPQTQSIEKMKSRGKSWKINWPYSCLKWGMNWANIDFFGGIFNVDSLCILFPIASLMLSSVLVWTGKKKNSCLQIFLCTVNVKCGEVTFCHCALNGCCLSCVLQDKKVMKWDGLD